MDLLHTLIDHKTGNKKLKYRDSSQAVLTPEIEDWFRKLVLLEGVPLSYLVPHPQQLPPESFRFFHLDANWIKALAAGAFSIGRHNASVTGQFTAFEDSAIQPITGILIRSELVRHYRGMHWKGYEEKAANIGSSLPTLALPLLRDDVLAPDVRIVLFDGLVQTVALFAPAESLELRADNAAWIDKTGVLRMDKIMTRHQQENVKDASEFVETLMSSGGYMLFSKG